MLEKNKMWTVVSALHSQNVFRETSLRDDVSIAICDLCCIFFLTQVCLYLYFRFLYSGVLLQGVLSNWLVLREQCGRNLD
jgi:hypothetical protein